MDCDRSVRRYLNNGKKRFERYYCHIESFYEIMNIVCLFLKIKDVCYVVICRLHKLLNV